MGMWDGGGFANDDALDWLAQLDPAEGLQPIRQVLHAVVGAADAALDVRQAGRVLAAVELVAASGGHPHPALPESARRWCTRQTEAPDGATRVLATRALDLVGTSSGLAELWSQRADEAEWHRELDGLRMRLTPPAGDANEPLEP